MHQRESPGDLTTAVDGVRVDQLGGYVLGAPLGDGGMGVIFAAEHPETRRPVAIKVIGRDAGGGVERFAREIGALASLRHPAIVEYIGHGTSDDGRPFLVMERLSGEDLHRRLQRGPLTITEAIELGARIAAALAAAHALDIVHRDIKPSNIFLPGGKIEDAKLLDFGVARLRHDERALTRTGAMIGTLGYMAPEQARGERDLDGRADLFSLGCVLHECLAGTAAFSGEHAMAVLAKILLDQAPRLRSLRSDVPAALDELVASLLAKRAVDRPASAAAVTVILASCSCDGAVSAERRATGSGVTLRERRVFSLLLVRVPTPGVDPLATTSADDPVGVALSQLAASLGATYSPVLGGAGLVSVELEAPASDVALQSARCALAIQRRFPNASQVLATGRGERSGRSIVGGVIDHVSAMEKRSTAGAILLDRTTAELIGDAFALERRAEDIFLSAERAMPADRLLLGKPAPFVGRARELAWLTGVYRQAVEESHSRVALVTAPPGTGKSRLFREFARTLSWETPVPTILIGRGSPLTRDAALGMLRSAVQLAAQIDEEDDLAARREKLRRRLDEYIAQSDHARILGFIGEMAGIPGADPEGKALPPSPRDPRVMADGVRLAWLDWLRAECRHHPLVLVLEDLHWGDTATVMLVDAALQMLSDLPFVVLGLARPDVHARFEDLWADRARLDLDLPPISARASESIIRHVLGGDVGQQYLQDLAVRAAGNPLFLEELIRATTEGAVGELPETVLSVVQARIAGVDDESRRLLRAASVFGGAFSEAGVRAVLGEASGSVAAILTALVHQELLDRETTSDGRTFRFRHALVRDAAYAMLIDDDMRLAHELAGDWLARQEGAEPLAIAEHLVRAEQPERARMWYRRAAEQALASGDLRAAVERAEQALECGALGAERAELRLLQAEARSWTGSLDDAERWAIEAAEGSPQESSTWFAAVRKVIYCTGVRGDLESALAWLERAEQVKASPGAPWGFTYCLCEALYAIHIAGDSGRANPILDRLVAQVSDHEGHAPPAVLGEVHRAHANDAIVSARFDRAAASARQAAHDLELAGDARGASRMNVIEGHCLGQVGAYQRAEEVLRAAEVVAERLGVEQTLIYARGTRGEILVRRGDLRQARVVLTGVLERCRGRRDPRATGATMVALGSVELGEGHLEEAEALVRAGQALLAGQTLLETWARAILAQVIRTRGREGEAAELAAAVAARMQGLGGFVECGWLVWSILLECLEGQVTAEAFEASLDAALAHLRTRVERLADLDLRLTLLRLPENQALVARARELGRPVGDLRLEVSTVPDGVAQGAGGHGRADLDAPKSP